MIIEDYNRNWGLTTMTLETIRPTLAPVDVFGPSPIFELFIIGLVIVVFGGTGMALLLTELKEWVVRREEHLREMRVVGASE